MTEQAAQGLQKGKTEEKDEKEAVAPVEKTSEKAEVVVVNSPDKLEAVAKKVKERLAAKKAEQNAIERTTGVKNAEKAEVKKPEEKKVEVKKQEEKKPEVKKPGEKAVDLNKVDSKKVEYVLQRKAVVPLLKAYAKPAKKRARAAIILLRKFGARHGKTAIENVKIDEKLASFINSRGAKKPPKKLKVTLLKDKSGNVKLVPA